MNTRIGNRVSVAVALVALGLKLSALQPAEAAEFLNTATMNRARYYHSATLLPNGMVLVAGGGENTILSDAELFDPATGRWTATGRLRAARYIHTATLLPTGKVLVAGGFSQLPTTIAGISSAELYDPASGTWSFTGAMKSARDSHTATLLPNGKVLVAGGTGISSAELYDPSSGTWSFTGAMRWARRNHTATLLPNGKVLVAGGGFDATRTTAELYDPATGTWTLTGSLITPRSGHTATLLPNGKVLVASDGAAEEYDPDSGTWSPPGPMIKGHGFHTATLLPNGKVLVVGGSGDGNGVTAELYDPAAGTWTETSTMTYGRWTHTATLLPNGRVLVAAGNDIPATPAVHSSAEIYEPDADSAAPSIAIIHHDARLMSFSWSGVGTLEQSENLAAPDWQRAPIQDNPHIVGITGPMKFFRLRFNQ